MDLLTALLVFVILLAVIGVVVWAVTTLIPMPQPFKIAIYAVCAIVVLLLLLRFVLQGLPPLLIQPLVGM